MKLFSHKYMKKSSRCFRLLWTENGKKNSFKRGVTFKMLKHSNGSEATADFCGLKVTDGVYFFKLFNST